jgi:hypothetical protein
MTLFPLDELPSICKGSPNVLYRDFILPENPGLDMPRFYVKRHDGPLFELAIAHRSGAVYGASIPALRIERYWS